MLFLVSKVCVLSVWGRGFSGMWNFVAWLVVVAVSKYRGASKRREPLTERQSYEYLKSRILCINSKVPMRRRFINISESTILLCQCLTQHTLTTSLNNAASAGDNNHRCQTFTGDLPLPATDTKCVHYCQQKEHEQGVQLSWPEQVQGKCDSPVGLLRGWPVAAELLWLSVAWLTIDSLTSKATCCVVDYWQPNF